MIMEEKKEEKKKKPIILIILILVIIALLGALAFLLLRDEKTAIIEDTNMELQDAEEAGMLRIKMSPYITIKKDTMQNLDFYNLNEGRLLQVKIKANNKYVYESPLIEAGKVINADIINTRNLSKGDTEAIAEVYSYTLDEEFVGQTNVEIILNNQ